MIRFFRELRNKAVAPQYRTVTPIIIVLTDEYCEHRWTKPLSDLMDRIWSKSERPILLLSSKQLDQKFRKDLSCEETIIDPADAYDILIFSETGEDIALPTNIVACISELKVGSIRQIDPGGKTQICKRSSRPGAEKVLFVFPGIFVPARMGSHKRALSIVVGLINAGFSVDILVSSSSSKSFETSLKYLRLLSASVHCFTVPNLKEARSTRRAVYERLCEEFDLSPRFPVSFQDRLELSINEEGRDLVRQLAAANRYRAIIVSYAWMVEVVPAESAAATRLICDTHDVHAHRLALHQDMIAQVIYPLQEERRLEIAALARCDHVLAISQRDEILFRDEYGLGSVETVEVSYQLTPVMTRPRARSLPLKFGFIGSAMEANRLALTLILEAWWPQIATFSPQSTLLVAGAICADDEIQSHAFLREDIRMVGAVDSATEFFGDIDVLLSPVIMPGGLNIKAVEALLADCVVITNKLGAEALQPLTLLTRCETAQELVGLVGRLEARDENLVRSIEKTFAEARRLFADEDKTSAALKAVIAAEAVEVAE